MSSSFTHLHVHTEFSMLDGAAKLDELVAAAVADGQPALGMTDHGNMYGVLEFYKECTAAGITRNDALWNDMASPEGVGTATIFAHGQSRSTGVDALLRSAIAAGRVRVDRGASVSRLIVRDGVVRGVELSGGEELDARGVVVCAGAFGSVELLQRSGLVPTMVRGVQDHP
ncbi:MAG: PHP domain-containing protein, partial [Oxalobacteraceae bacterium]|nr:PHP domain-containing protein [Oxalobacteraceae bacterium]